MTFTGGGLFCTDWASCIFRSRVRFGMSKDAAGNLLAREAKAGYVLDARSPR